MTASSKKRQWSLRTRLTALITAVLVAGGAAILAVQYLLVRGLFDTAIDGITTCVSDDGFTVVGGEDPLQGLECTDIASGAGTSTQGQVSVGTDGTSVLVEQSTMLSQEVLAGLLFWSIITLLTFTAIAVIAASWLSRRSFARIGQITDTTKRITRQDLHQRLNLPGPADEIKELGDTIDTMLEGLEISFTQQERFITNASHELRTPLTTTRTALEIPLTQGQVPEHLEPAIKRALGANQRSEQLIAALLRLAMPAHTLAHDDEEPIHLPAIIEQSLSDRRTDIVTAELTVTANLRHATVTAVRRTLLTLAIDNLIDNAIRHNVDQGHLRVSTGTSAGTTWIEIANSGSRYSDEEAARLREPFNRGHDTRTAGNGRSLGLGLSLVQNIVDSAGATLTLVPRPEGGLLARIEF